MRRLSNDSMLQRLLIDRVSAARRHFSRERSGSLPLWMAILHLPAAALRPPTPQISAAPGTLSDLFSGLAAGQQFGPLPVGFDPTTLGTFSETIDLLGIGSNASGYNAPVADVFLTIEATVISSGPSVPEPASMTVLASGLGMVFFIVRRRRRTRCGRVRRDAR